MNRVSLEEVPSTKEEEECYMLLKIMWCLVTFCRPSWLLPVAGSVEDLFDKLGLQLEYISLILS